MSKHAMTRAVARSLPALELRRFQEWDDRDRWAEIHELAQAQVRDDVDNVMGPRADRIGDSWVLSRADAGDHGRPLWERTTPEQDAIAVRLTPLLLELTPKQREVIRLLYFGSLTGRQAAAVMGIDESTLREHHRAALTKLRKLIQERYLAPASDTAD